MKVIDKKYKVVTLELSNEEFRLLSGLLLTVITGVNQFQDIDWEDFQTETGFEEKDVRNLNDEFHDAYPLKDN